MVDQADDAPRVAVRVVAAEQLAAESGAHEMLGGDEHLRLGAPEAIDALLGIADDEHARRPRPGPAVAAQPGMQRLPLQRIGVLELVDQQVRDARVEPLLHPARQRRLAQQQLRGLLDVVHVDPAVPALDFGEGLDQQPREPRHALLVAPGGVLGLGRAQHLQFGLGGLGGLVLAQVVGQPVLGGDEEGLAQPRQHARAGLAGGHAVAEDLDDRLGRLLRRLVGFAPERGGAGQPLAPRGLGGQRVDRLAQAVERRMQHAEGLHRRGRIGQAELHAPRQGLAERLGDLRAPMRGDQGAIVGERVGIGGHGLEERSPGMAARLGVVLQQLVVRRQAERRQGGDRRIAHQSGEPGVEGAELHRSPAVEQPAVQPLQAGRGGGGGGRRHAAQHQLDRERLGRLAGELREPLVEPRAHLAGGLAGEGDGQDLVRFAGALALLQQRADDARDQHPGLAGAGAGLHRHIAARVAGDAVEGLARHRSAVVLVGRRGRHRQILGCRGLRRGGRIDRRDRLRHRQAARALRRRGDGLVAPGIAAAQPAGIAVLADRALAERRQRGAIGDAGEVVHQPGHQRIARGDDVELLDRLRPRRPLADVDIGRAQGVVGHQGGIERELGVLGRVLDAVVGGLGGFGLVVDDEGPAIAGAVDAVEAADQSERSQRLAHPWLGLDEFGPGGLVRAQPVEVAVAHRRPGGGERQELGRAQSRLARRARRRVLHQAQAPAPVEAGRLAQGLVEVAEHGMQPVAEVALVDLGVDLVGVAQAELAQREEAIGAAAQVLVDAGGDGGQRQVGAAGRRAHRRAHGDGIGDPGVGAVDRATIQSQGLQQRARPHRLAGRVRAAPEQVAARLAQRHGPGGALRGLERVARRQAQRQALRRGPGTGRLGRGRQATFVAAGHHHGIEGAPEELLHRQHDDMRRGPAGRRHEAAGLEHVTHPAGELAQGEAALGEPVDGAGGRTVRAPGGRRAGLRLGFGIGVQPQRRHDAGAGRVGGQRVPGRRRLQQPAQVAQPVVERARLRQPGATRVDGERQAAQRLVLVPRARADGTRPAPPLAQALAAQARLQRVDLAGRQIAGALEPVEHLVARGLARAGPQGAHQRRRGAGGGELPAGLVVRGHAQGLQLRGDPARQHAVGGDQRDGRVALGQPAHHAGRRALGLVLRIGCGMQRGGPARRLAGRERDALGGLAPQLAQGERQRIGLQALQHDQQVDMRGPGAAQQHVGGIGRVGHPGQRDGIQRALGLEPFGVAFDAQCRLQLQHPGGARIGVARGGERRELVGQLDQAAGEHLLVGAEARLRQQRLRGDQVARHVEDQIVRRRREVASGAGPVARGLEARRRPGGRAARPHRAGHADELRVRHQHDAARGPRAMALHDRFDARHQTPFGVGPECLHGMDGGSGSHGSEGGDPGGGSAWKDGDGTRIRAAIWGRTPAFPARFPPWRP